MDRRDWDRTCEQVAESHAAILRTLHRLEDAMLATNADPRRWVSDVHRELSGLLDLLEEHRKSTAPPAGLVGLIELHGHSRGVSNLLATHDRLLDDAQRLLRSLDSTSKPEAPYSPVRRDAAHLASAVRKHEAEESALIYETDVRVSGGEG